MNRHPPHHAFTLVELLVAVALTLVMLVAINRIFSDTQKAIGGGTGLSRVVADSRVMVQQIRRDADMMIGPHRKTRKPMHGPWVEPMHGGMLVIVQREIEAPVPAVGGQGQVLRKVRSDQLAFIRARGDEDPITPEGANNYTAEHLNDADFLRIWYGHVRRTSPLGDGNDAANQPDDPTRAGALGRPPETVTGPHDQRYSVDNELASQWILGRQALFLKTRVDQTASANFPPVALEGGDPYDNGSIRGLPSGMPIPKALYMGLTDIAWYGFDRECLGYDLAPQHGAIVGGAPNFGGPKPQDTLLRLWMPLPHRGSLTSYIQRAVFYNTFAHKRLRVNPTPVFNHEAGFDLPAWQVAQMHPYFVGGVSDFIVEFAGDYDPLDQQIDTVAQNPAWPGDDTDTHGVKYLHQGGEVRWYDAYTQNNAPDPRHDENDPTAAKYDSTKPPRYEFPSNAVNVGNPVGNMNPMWRDINDYISSDSNALPHADHVFVFRHEDDGRYTLPFVGGPAPGSMWPDMIRLRWRMHDPQNQLFDARTSETGKWFEMIIPIPRPTRP